MERNSALTQRIFLVSLFLVCVYMLWPFLPYVLIGAILAVLSYPLVTKFKSFGLGQLSASLITTTLASLILFLPLSLLIFIGARTATENLPSLVQEMNPQFFQNLLHRQELMKAQNFLRRAFGFDPENLHDYLIELSQQVGESVAQSLARLLAHLPVLTVEVVILILSLVYCLMAAPDLLALWRRHSVFDLKKTLHLEQKFLAICNALVLAALAIALVQSTVFGVVCFALGLSNVSVIGLLVFFFSFFPVIGAAPLTLGISSYHLIAGESTTGIILLVVAIFISLIDNFIRPILLKQSAAMNPILAIFAIIGGLRVFGFAGIFLGPLLVGIMLESYRMLYADRL